MNTIKHRVCALTILPILVATSLVGLADENKTAAGSEDKTPAEPKIEASTPAERKDTDHIAELVATLKKSMGLWKNGTYVPIYLPADAKPLEALNKALESEQKESPLRKKHNVVEVRKVMGDHLAVLLDYPDGSRIFLCNYQGDSWWHRFYEVPDSKAEQAAPSNGDKPSN